MSKRSKERKLLLAEMIAVFERIGDKYPEGISMTEIVRRIQEMEAPDKTFTQWLEEISPEQKRKHSLAYLKNMVRCSFPFVQRYFYEKSENKKFIEPVKMKKGDEFRYVNLTDPTEIAYRIEQQRKIISYHYPRLERLLELGVEKLTVEAIEKLSDEEKELLEKVVYAEMTIPEFAKKKKKEGESTEQEKENTDVV